MRRTDPRAPLHPQVKSLFDALAALRPDQPVLDAAVMRAQSAAFAPLLNQGAPAVAIEREIRIPGPAGDIRAVVFAPANPTGLRMPMLVYIHGGGFVNLSPETHAKLTKQLAVGATTVVVSLDYRLAPESPYPAGLDDCIAAFRWIRSNAASLGGDASRVSIAGDSAGGNLSATTTLRLLAKGDAPPRSVALLCAWLDLAMDTESFRAFGPDDPIIDDTVMEYYRASYTPDPNQWNDPLISPLRGDLSAFPPTCIVVGDIDPLRDDGIRFADRLRSVGRDVILHNHAGMPHVFMLFPGVDAAETLVSQVSAFLRRTWA